MVSIPITVLHLDTSNEIFYFSLKFFFGCLFKLKKLISISYHIIVNQNHFFFGPKKLGARRIGFTGVVEPLLSNCVDGLGVPRDLLATWLFELTLVSCDSREASAC